jgi:hypothetical protein
MRYFKVKSTLELLYFRDYCAGQTDEKLASFIDLRQVDRVELFTKMTGPSPEYGFKLESCTGTTLVSCLLPESVTPFPLGLGGPQTIEVSDCPVADSQKEQRDDWARLLIKISGNNATATVATHPGMDRQGSDWWRRENSPTQAVQTLPAIQAVMGASRPLEPEELVVDEFNSLPDVVNPFEKVVVVLVRRLGTSSGLGLFIDKTGASPTLSVWVAGFTPNSPAGEAIPRLRRGDTILDINEKSTASMDSDEVSLLLQGDIVRLTLFRHQQKDGSGDRETFDAKHNVAKEAGVTEGELMDMEQKLMVLTAKREEMVMAQICMDLDFMEPAERQSCVDTMESRFKSMDRSEHGCVSHTNFATVLQKFDLQPEELDLLFGHYDRHDTMHFYYNDFLAALRKVISSHQVAGLVDLSTLSSANNRGLMAQPKEPDYRCAIVECYVAQHPLGGADKSAGGNRYDSVFLANGVIHADISCQIVRYVPDQHEAFFATMKAFDALIVRCAPGQIHAIGGSQANFDIGLRALCKGGVKVWSSPVLTSTLGTKDALTKIRSMAIGLPDTCTYDTAAAFAAGFKKTIAAQPRVIKRSCGTGGAGVWVVKLQTGNYQPGSDRTAQDTEMLELVEANDNHVETHTVAEFVEFCLNGRTEKSGEWSSQGHGKYLAGGKAAGALLVDQRFCPRIAEGELRMSMVADVPVAMAHIKPQQGGVSALTSAGATDTLCDIHDPKFADLVDGFTKKDLPALVSALGVPEEPLPLWWSVDFVNAAAAGAPDKWVVSDFNVSCAGIMPALAARATTENTSANYEDVKDGDLTKAVALANMVGMRARTLLEKSKGAAVTVVKEKAELRKPLEDLCSELLVKGKQMTGAKAWAKRWVHISAANDGHRFLHICKARGEEAKSKIDMDEVKSIITSPHSHPSVPHCYKLKTSEGATVVTIASAEQGQMQEWYRCLQHIIHMKHHEGVRHSGSRRRATRPGDPGHDSQVASQLSTLSSHSLLPLTQPLIPTPTHQQFMAHGKDTHLGLLRRGHFKKFEVEFDRTSKDGTLKELGLQLDSAVSGGYA